jgi:hypothetical protein
MSNRYRRLVAAVLITFGLLAGTAIAATLGSSYPGLIALR